MGDRRRTADDDNNSSSDDSSDDERRAYVVSSVGSGFYPEDGTDAAFQHLKTLFRFDDVDIDTRVVRFGTSIIIRRPMLLRSLGRVHASTIVRYVVVDWESGDIEIHM